MKDLIETNIRSIIELDDTELKASLQEFGWHREFPALQDEHGKLLVGHRRMRLALELGIDPVIKTLYFGEGEAADASRLKLALISNLGSAPLSHNDRQRIAEYLYGEREWTMQRIGQALGVTHKTISKDLEGFVPKVQTTRPQGGRPKGKAKTAAPIMVAMKDAGKSVKEIAKATGVGERNVAQELEHEAIRREARLEASITEEVLSLSAQQKLDIAIRRETKRLEEKFHAAVEAKVEERIGFLLDHLKEREHKISVSEEWIRSYKGFKFKKTVYNKILHCLHPDSRLSISKERLEAAFHAFEGAERHLVTPKELPPDTRYAMPSSKEELAALKEKVREERRAERAAKRGKLK